MRALLLTFILLLLLSSAHAENTPLRVVLDDGYPPYSFRAADGTLQGMLIDEWRLWQEKTGIPVQLDALPWPVAQRRMDAGEYDVIDMVSKTPTRQVKYDFSPPYATIELPVFFRDKINGISDLKSLDGFPVAVKGGGAVKQMLRDAGVDPLMEYPGYEELVQAAADGKVNVFVGARPPVLFYLYRSGIAGEFHQTAPLEVVEFHRAVKKGDAETLALVNRGFKLIRPEEREAISRHWLGTELLTKTFSREVQIVLGLLVLTALLLLTWIVTLRITVRKKVRELQASKDRLRLLLKAIPDIVFRLDHELKFIDYHAAETATLLVPPESFIGRTVFEVLPAEVAAQTAAAAEIVLRENAAEYFEYDLLLPDGVRHWFAARLCPGGGEEVLATVRDITERKRVEIELFSAWEAAKSAESSKSIFLANMSHEIRTPLNGILGMLEVLKDLDPTEEQVEYLQDATTCGWSLLRLLNEILDISKIEASEMEFRSGPVFLDRLEAAVYSTFTPLLKDRSVKLQIHHDQDVPNCVYGDETRIRQILLNLVGNAVKFTEAGAVVLTAKLKECQDPGKLRLQFIVEDSGIGIPEEKLAVIFEPFTQVDSSYRKRFQGTGLGLSIVKKLVERMHGTVAVRSTLGRGTIVVAEIEVSRFPVEDGKGRAQEGSLSLKTIKGLRILLVEDNEINRKMATQVLTRRGHVVTATTNGKEALEVLTITPFDLVLMDIQMPVMDGVEAFGLLRSGAVGGVNMTTPVVALTAYAMDDERERFLALGMNGYVEKPLRWEKVDEVLCALFPEREGEQERIAS